MSWLRQLAATTPATWPHTRAIRSAFGVGGPLVAGTLVGHTGPAMWVSMGALLLAAGERDVSYGERFRLIGAVVPVAASAFALGLLSHAPAGVVIAVMTLLAFLFGIVSGYSHVLSVATMQALLIGAVVIGVSAAAPYWPAALLFIGGAAFYTLMLALEAWWDRRRPSRTALQAVLLSLAELAEQQAMGADDLAPYRQRVVTELNNFDVLALQRRRASQGPTRAYLRAARISRAADQLLARLLAHDARGQRSQIAAARLRVLAIAVQGRTAPPAGDDPTLVRVHMLEAAIWQRDIPASGFTPTTARTHRTAPPGRDLIVTALRLAVCTAAAYAVLEFTPLPHGYWVALTVALVMKPDLGSVFARAVLRSAGTIAGAVIALAVGLTLPGGVWFALAMFMLAAVMPWAIARSYALQALIMTPLIMLMITLVVTADSIPDLTLDRIVATVLGGAIVLVLGYACWPQARHPQLAPKVGSAITALAAYADVVASTRDGHTVSAARRTAYRVLSDAQVGVQRTLAEPPPAGAEAAAWLPILSTAERVADRITDASASFEAPDHTPDATELRVLADALAHFNRHSTSTGSDTLPEAFDDPTLQELADEIQQLRTILLPPQTGQSRLTSPSGR